MKVTKVPGLGRFGHFIDDVDLNTITDDQWNEIGKIHLQGLVTIIRGNDISHRRYYELITKWGFPRYNHPIKFYLKYGKPLKQAIEDNDLDEEDMLVINNVRRWQVDRLCYGMGRVTPKKNRKGQAIGIFGDGELLWHSNESGDAAFTPCVSLMGWENMVGSCTGFCTTTNWYEEQTDSFRSELDEMILIHNYRPNSVSPTYIEEQENYYKSNTCPEENNPLPLVIKSPGGVKGLHLSVHTADYIQGMTREESNKLISRIKDEIFVDKYMYKHWYQHDKDLLIFDNSIVLHNRELEKESMPDRVGYRIQFDYDKLTGETYMPFFQEKFNQVKLDRLQLLREAIAGMEPVYGR